MGSSGQCYFCFGLDSRFVEEHEVINVVATFGVFKDGGVWVFVQVSAIKKDVAQFGGAEGFILVENVYSGGRANVNV